MEYYGKGEAFMGGAGILPAATGMLPVASFSRHGAAIRNSFSARSSAVRQNAGQGGQHARAPLRDRTIHNLTIQEVHAHRSYI
jgi:hypothetical protein